MFVYAPITLSAISASAPIIPYSLGNNGAQVGPFTGPLTTFGLLCSVSAGANLTYSVQISCDVPNVFTNWIDHDILTALTVTAYSQIIYPVSGIRLNLTARVSGSVSLGVVSWP